MSPAQQAKFQAAADKMSADNIKRFDAQETETLEYFKKEGKKVYEPDTSRRSAPFAQKKYVDKYGKDWPKGALEKINAVT